MRKYLLLSHGNFAKGASDSLKMFLGKRHPFQVITAYHDASDPKTAIEHFFSSLQENDEAIICTDLPGGSVNQLVLPYMRRANTYVIAGFNFPLLMELSFLSEPLQKEQLVEVIKKAQASLVLMNDYHFDYLDDKDE